MEILPTVVVVRVVVEVVQVIVGVHVLVRPLARRSQSTLYYLIGILSFFYCSPRSGGSSRVSPTRRDSIQVTGSEVGRSGFGLD